MHNHDFVSDGFLALIATGLVLLCSSLLVIAFSKPLMLSGYSNDRSAQTSPSLQPASEVDYR